MNDAISVGRGLLEVRFESAAQHARSFPPLVFLHEGLGSISMWRSFPESIRVATGHPTTLVYSRHGYGRSAVVSEPRGTDFLQIESDDVLPRLLDHYRVRRPVLIGHSDGASIALLHAGGGHDVAALVVMAPHVFVEDVSIAGVLATRQAFETGGIRERLSRHHDDVDSTFAGWSNAWLLPAFRSWRMEERLRAISCPVLMIQGEDDGYGTLAQLDAIEESVSGPTERLVLPGVGHSPHLEAPEVVRDAIADFLARVVRGRS